MRRFRHLMTVLIPLEYPSSTYDVCTGMLCNVAPAVSRANSHSVHVTMMVENKPNRKASPVLLMCCIAPKSGYLWRTQPVSKYRLERKWRLWLLRHDFAIHIWLGSSFQILRIAPCDAQRIIRTTLFGPYPEKRQIALPCHHPTTWLIWSRRPCIDRTPDQPLHCQASFVRSPPHSWHWDPAGLRLNDVLYPPHTLSPFIVIIIIIICSSSSP